MDCLFCKIVSGEIPSSKVYEDDQVIAFHDIHPQARVHVLVVPRKHIARVAEMTEADIPLLGQMVYAARRIAHDLQIDSGFRLVMNNGADANQTVFHIHLHVLGGRKFGWPPG